VARDFDIGRFLAARRRGETALGYRIGAQAAGNAGMAYGVHTNPHKSEAVTFAAEDKVIVIAES
jgi:Fe-S cluster assembly iron-binding protein IscA